MKKFTIDGDVLDIFKELDYQEIGMIVVAIGRYCIDGTFTLDDDITDRAVKIAVNVLKRDIDRAEEVRQRCSDAGKKGMRERYK